MDYIEFERDCSSKPICIWGFGLYGKIYAYFAIRCAGGSISCFCDSNSFLIGEYLGIPLVSKEKLYAKKGLLVYIAIDNSEEQERVANELDNYGIEHKIFDSLILSDLCNSIEASGNEEILAKYYLLMDDRTFLRKLYHQKLNKKLNLERPESFNEKMQWLKINNRNPRYTELVDKYEVKRFVASKVGGEHVLLSLGIWNGFEDIEFETLPEQFVLKCTHDSGSLIICDKKNLDLENIKKRVTKSIRTNYYWRGREWPYKNIEPRIIVEPYMVDESMTELKDYKVFCFNGIPKYIQVDYNRFVKHERNIYSIDWKYMGFTSLYPTNPNVIIQKPKRLSDMLEIARVLSAGIPHARIDLYYVDSKIYVGEITLFHGSGFEKYTPEMWDYKLGNLVNISGIT